MCRWHIFSVGRSGYAARREVTGCGSYLTRVGTETCPYKLFTPVFAGMMDKGLIKRDDAAMLAFSYTTPISALIRLCDREPERTEEAMERIEAFSRHFINTYGKMD